MINALNKPSDEKTYADAAAQFAYRAYGFSDDQYNYIVSSIDKQFMEIIKMEMMYQEFIAQRGDYFEEKYPQFGKVELKVVTPAVGAHIGYGILGFSYFMLEKK